MPTRWRRIVSRAIPEMTALSRKPPALYCMYKMGLLTGARTGSANVVGAVTMHYNPHGDSAIYDTMVRLSKSTARCSRRLASIQRATSAKVLARYMAWAPRYTGSRICLRRSSAISRQDGGFCPETSR